MRRVFEKTAKAAYVGARSAATRAFERRAGIRTEGYVGADELGFDDERQRYQPARWFQLRRILKPRDVRPWDVFIDLGSGMGRVVYQAAAWYPFKRVIGLELSERLHEVARQNVERTRDRLRCSDVELVNRDVLAYELPDDVTVVYMNNPFRGSIFQATVDKLVASLERTPRSLRVIYGNPIEERMLLDAGFRQVAAVRGFRPTATWSRSNAVRMYARDAPGVPSAPPAPTASGCA